MAGSVICGIDDSKSAKAAARVARALSSKLGLRLVFVRVLEPCSPQQTIGAVAERLHQLTEAGTSADCGADWLVDVGRPADRLVAAAAEEQADLIVVGSTRPGSSLVGSISAEVSRRAPCPVVVVPPDADESPAGGHAEADGDTEFAGGIARFSLGSSKQTGETEFAGGIARFNFGFGGH